MIGEYRGPVYSMGWTHKDRSALQQHNILLLQQAFNRLKDKKIMLDNKPVLDIFSGLQLNTKIPPLSLDYDYQVSAMFSPTEMVLGLEDESHFSLGSFKQSSTTYRKKVGENNQNCLELRGMDLAIPFGFEGQGLGAGLADGASILTQKWIKAMNLGGVDLIFSRCLATSRFSPEVSNEQLLTSERAGWTPELLKKYGYTNNQDILKYYLGAEPYELYPNKESLYIKVLLDRSKGINLIK